MVSIRWPTGGRSIAPTAPTASEMRCSAGFQREGLSAPAEKAAGTGKRPPERIRAAAPLCVTSSGSRSADTTRNVGDRTSHGRSGVGDTSDTHSRVDGNGRRSDRRTRLPSRPARCVKRLDQERRSDPKGRRGPPW